MQEKSGAATASVVGVALAERKQAWTLLWYANMARIAMSKPSFLLDAKTHSRFWMRGHTICIDSKRAVYKT